MACPYRFFYSAVAIVLAAGIYSCSSSPKNNDAGTLDNLSDSKSGADEVGSIPEDMLANEKGVDGADATPDTVADAKAEPKADAGGADPFADLKAGDGAEGKKTEATTVEEAVAEPKSGASTTGETSSYSVKSGDTLMKIAFNLYGDVDRWKDLEEWNRGALKHGNALRKGMKLKYEVPSEAFQQEQLAHSYEIKKGDTLAGIADDLYGRKAKYKKLQGYNSKLIRNPNRIFAGFTIFYDITPKEVAEAEARHHSKGDTASSAAAAPAPAPAEQPPSALAPPEPTPAKNVAVTPAGPAPAQEPVMGPSPLPAGQ